MSGPDHDNLPPPPPQQQVGGAPPPPPVSPGGAPPPPAGFQQPAQYQPTYGQTQGTNGLAIASLVLGILWLYWIGSILAVIFGHIALVQTRERNQGGRGLAIAGLVLGYIGVAVLAIGIIALIANPDLAEDSLRFSG